MIEMFQEHVESILRMRPNDESIVKYVFLIQRLYPYLFECFNIIFTVVSEMGRKAFTQYGFKIRSDSTSHVEVLSFFF